MFHNLLFGLVNQFSVGTPLQNFGVYTIIMVLLLTVVVQINAHHETGVRKLLIRFITIVRDKIYKP
ncbi:hypothetical protein [Mucilaginibacter sp.]|uniref:hypothetical protein n=1 Tax=Mucilaginibacter sp. TaxID=1882438 RepID=UPI0035BBB42C